MKTYGAPQFDSDHPKKEKIQDGKSFDGYRESIDSFQEAIAVGKPDR